MKQNLLLYVLVCMLLCSCEKNSGIKLSEEAANAIVHKNLGIDQLNIPPDGGEDGGKKVREYH